MSKNKQKRAQNVGTSVITDETGTTVLTQEKPKVEVKEAEITDEELSKRITGVSAYLSNANPTKVMSLFNRTKNDNVKLDKFLSKSFTQPQAFKNREEAQKAIDGLIAPKNHEHHGLVAVKQQRALLAVLVEKFLKQEVEAKTKWVASFNLEGEQVEKAAEAIEAYNTFLVRNARASAKLWEQVYGIAE